MQRAFTGQENPKITAIAEIATTIALKLSIMENASAQDRPRYKLEVRQLTQDFADKVMDLANAFLR
jgi:hypothetical protein